MGRFDEPPEEVKSNNGSSISRPDAEEIADLPKCAATPEGRIFGTTECSESGTNAVAIESLKVTKIETFIIN